MNGNSGGTPALGEAAIEDRLRGSHEMHEVAVAAARALTFLVLSAPADHTQKQASPSLAEIGNGGVLHGKRSSGEVSPGETFQRLFGVLLVLELHVYVAEHVLAHVVAHVQLLDGAVRRGQLIEDLLVELIKLVLLRVTRKDKHYNHLPIVLGVSRHGVCFGIVIHLLDQNGLTKRGSVVLSSAPVAVSARSNLKIEWTVHSTQSHRTGQRYLSSSVPYTRTKWSAISYVYS